MRVLLVLFSASFLVPLCIYLYEVAISDWDEPEYHSLAARILNFGLAMTAVWFTILVEYTIMFGRLV